MVSVLSLPSSSIFSPPFLYPFPLSSPSSSPSPFTSPLPSPSLPLPCLSLFSSPSPPFSLPLPPLSFSLSSPPLSLPLSLHLTPLSSPFPHPALEEHPPVPLNGFVNKLLVMRTNDNQLFLEEFGSIPMAPQFPNETANLSYNQPKNRYNNILAYDHSRVRLNSVRGQQGSDYINANYCAVSGMRVQYDWLLVEICFLTLMNIVPIFCS